jgi:hypothetical protein
MRLSHIIFMLAFFGCISLYPQDLKVEKIGWTVLISYPGGNGIPSWKTVVDRNFGGNITALHVPADNVNFSRGSTFPPFVPQNIFSGNKDNFTGVPSQFSIVKESPDTVIITFSGTSPRGSYTHARTYTFTREGIALTGAMTPSNILDNYGIYCPIVNGVIDFRTDQKLPVRTQGTAQWHYMASTGGDYPAPLPTGVVYPFEAYFKVKGADQVYFWFYYDKPFETMQNSHKFIYNIKSSWTTHILNARANTSNKQTYSIRVKFEDRNSQTGLPGLNKSESSPFCLTVLPHPVHHNGTLIVKGVDALKGGSHGWLKIFDPSGKLVKTAPLDMGRRSAHTIPVVWNPAGQPAGQYMGMVTLGDRVITKKITLIK